jgi:2'-5' RNA ligase
MYRLFIAVDIPADVKEHLANMCYGVTGAKWVSLYDMHFTLRLIGEVDEETYNDIVMVLDDVIASKFEMKVKGVGYFPPHNLPRVLWAGIDNPTQLNDVRKDIEHCLGSVGIKSAERKFAPHITLARLSDRTPAGNIADFLSRNALFASNLFGVTAFHLYSSVLTPNGAIHHKEASWPLL